MNERRRPPADDPSLSFDFDQAYPYPEDAAPSPAKSEPVVFSVAALARTLRGSVDRAFPRAVLVRGEVTGARPSPSGHLYFALKDEEEDAMIDVVVYKTSLTARARALVKDGARVRVLGKPSYWVPKGRLQLVGDRVDDEGKGALLEALERLKEKLTAEGLFAHDRKRALPVDPRVIGVVTSAHGAAIHDIARVAARRGGAHLLLAPAIVQGPEAPASIIRALKLVSRISGVDVVIVGRGGGSSEDLLAFSDEQLVRAVAACRVPVVSAVGHDVDVPLLDFVADARAATPSQAAEMLVPDRAGRRAELSKQTLLLKRTMRASLASRRHELSRRAHVFADARLVLASAQQKVDELSRRLAVVHPRAVLVAERSRLATLRERLGAAMRGRIGHERGDLGRAAASLDAMSPLKVLARGYSIALTAKKKAIRRADDVSVGDPITVRVHDGTVSASVTGKRRGDE